ncbi:spz [Trypoxylus dichotomus]
MFQMSDARPSVSDNKILFIDKPDVTTSRRKAECGNIVRLIDNQTDLFKCLLNAYISDVDHIIFPHSEEHRSEDNHLPPLAPFRKIPLCARNDQTFCENIDTYPYAKVQSFLQRDATPRDLFGVDEAPDEFVNRDSLEVERFMCETRQKLVFPKVGKTRDKTWKYIVNQNSSEGYIQGVLVRLCSSANGPCDFADYLPLGYTTTCKQIYVYRRLLSLDKKGITYNDYFELPSGCCCSYKRDYNYRRSANAFTKKLKIQQR